MTQTMEELSKEEGRRLRWLKLESGNFCDCPTEDLRKLLTESTVKYQTAWIKNHTEV